MEIYYLGFYNDSPPAIRGGRFAASGFRSPSSLLRFSANCQSSPDNRDFLHEYAKNIQVQQAAGSLRSHGSLHLHFASPGLAKLRKQPKRYVSLG
jgi:hypothetical protein